MIVAAVVAVSVAFCLLMVQPMGGAKEHDAGQNRPGQVHGQGCIVFSRPASPNGPWVTQGDLIMSKLCKYYEYFYK